MTEPISLPDQYVLLLQDVVNENRRLREQMIETAERSEFAFRSLENKMDNHMMAQTGGGRRAVRHTGQKRQIVPKACSVSITFLFSVYVK